MREGSAVGAALGFFLIVVAVMPLGLGPDLNLLSRIAPGVLWIAFMLAALLSVRRLFEVDAEDGSLEILTTGPLPLETCRGSEESGPLVDHRAPVDFADAGARLAAQPGHRRLSDAAGLPHHRHPGRELRGCHVRGDDLAKPPWRAAAGAAGAAALHPDADLRHSTINAALTAPAALGPSFLLLLAISLVSIVIAPVAIAAVLRLQLQ